MLARYTCRNRFTVSVRARTQIAENQRFMAASAAIAGPPPGACTLPRQSHPMLRPSRSTAPGASLCALALVFWLAASVPSAAQAPDPTAPPPKPVEVELNLINLPTTLPVKRHGSYFRLTHRFARDLRRGDFGSLVEDFFSLDNGAIIGLEYRFGVTANLHAGVHRSLLNRTIQFFGRYDGWKQSADMPLSLSISAAVEGLDNFRDNHQPAIAATVSREVARRFTVYATPAFVANTRDADPLAGHDHGVGTDEHADHEHTMFIGVGGRVRARPSVFITGEFSPRVAGHDPGRGTWGVALEKRTRGHTMQINFTNSFGTTFGQLARGGDEHNVYLGFNVTRTF